MKIHAISILLVALYFFATQQAFGNESLEENSKQGSASTNQVEASVEENEISVSLVERVERTDGSWLNFFFAPEIGKSATLKNILAFRCDANWDQTCEGHHMWTIPRTGWEICKFTVTVENLSQGEWRTSATADGINLYVKAWGSRFPFDRKGGAMHLILSSVQLIAKQESAQLRKERGCSHSNQLGIDGEFIIVTGCKKIPGQPIGAQTCHRFKVINMTPIADGNEFVCGPCMEYDNVD